MEDILPVGTEVIYEHEDKRAKLVIVAHSPPPNWEKDGEMLYMLAERPVSPPPDEYKVYSLEFLIYSLHAGWRVGHADRHLLKPTGRTVKVKPFLETEEGQMQRYHRVAA